MDLKLLRFHHSSQGTKGILIHDNLILSYTLELSWKNNVQNLSCIPTGEYQVKIRYSPKFGNVYEIKEVQDRSYVLIHSGNYAGDIELGFKTHVQGCILLGQKFGTLNNQLAILNSRYQLNKVMQYLGNKDFTLTIEG